MSRKFSADIPTCRFADLPTCRNHSSAGASPSSKVRKISFWRANFQVSRKNSVLEGELSGEPRFFCHVGTRPSSEPEIFSKTQLPQRSRPRHQIVQIPNRPIIVLVTVCTKDRQPWLASPKVHDTLVEIWKKATAWLVGRYVIMPDHIHLFASPCDEAVSLECWVRYWKSQFSKRHKNPNHRWQSGYWDTTLRSTESYDAKWEYVRHNPVRHGLVSKPEDWPFQGEIFVLEW